MQRTLKRIQVDSPTAIDLLGCYSVECHRYPAGSNRRSLVFSDRPRVKALPPGVVYEAVQRVRPMPVRAAVQRATHHG